MKTIVITGASSGIGHAIALRAAHANFATLLVARRGARLQTLAERIRALGGLCAALALDIRQSGAPAAMVSTAIARYGRLDVLINNAGMAARGPLAAQTDGELQAQWDTNVLAPLRIMREALPELQKTQGQIFFFGSGVARVPTPGLGAYPPAKAAIRAAATQLRRELRGSGVAVTYVDPGVVDTGFMQTAGMAGPPTRFMVSPESVARKVVHAIRTRPATLNAVPWQTAFVALGEFLPRLTDAVFAHAPQIVGAEPLPAAPAAAPMPAIETVAPDTPSFERALEPVRRRMERVKLSPQFVSELLVPGTQLELGEVAMRWAGMPNKNERAAVAEVFEALTSAHYLEKSGEERWVVRRSSSD